MLGAVGSFTPRAFASACTACSSPDLARGDLAHGDLEVRSLGGLEQEVAVPVRNRVGRGPRRQGDEQGGQDENREAAHRDQPPRRLRSRSLPCSPPLRLAPWARRKKSASSESPSRSASSTEVFRRSAVLRGC